MSALLAVSAAADRRGYIEGAVFGAMALFLVVRFAWWALVVRRDERRYRAEMAARREERRARHLERRAAARAAARAARRAGKEAVNA